jgi:hypothetical protein
MIWWLGLRHTNCSINFAKLVPKKLCFYETNSEIAIGSSLAFIYCSNCAEKIAIQTFLFQLLIFQLIVNFFFI